MTVFDDQRPEAVIPDWLALWGGSCSGSPGADLEAVRGTDPNVWDLPAWLSATEWTPQQAA
jgi:hypothetical protein